jgi:hypothetical protein
MPGEFDEETVKALAKNVGVVIALEFDGRE